MYTIDTSIQTNKYSAYDNKMDYIVLHHTAHGNPAATTLNVTKYLAINPAQVSCHYVVGTQYDKKIYKIADHKRRTRHAGYSTREGKSGLNNYSIGIEVMSTTGNEFDDRQRGAVKWLVKKIMAEEGIASKDVIRHKDIAPTRKIDIGDSFWNGQYNSYEEYQNSLNEDVVVEPVFTQQEIVFFNRYSSALAQLINLNSRLWNENTEEGDAGLRDALHEANNGMRALESYLKQKLA